MADVTYSRVNWEDSPSTDTPINATNLNKMDAGISQVVTRANESMPYVNILDDWTDIGAVTTPNTYTADAMRVAELNTSLNDFKTYSTTEKVVGNWINGKPLYRKTVQVTAQNQSIGSNIGVCMIDDSHSFVRIDAINQYLPIHYYTPNGPMSWFIVCNNGVFLSEGSRVPFGYAGYTTYITVEYTKTTD